MTREEALLKPQYDSNEKVREVIKATNIHINNIYDDFESRICENCKYHHQGYLCLELGQGISTDKDFGCSKFERKEDV